MEVGENDENKPKLNTTLPNGGLQGFSSQTRAAADRPLATPWAVAASLRVLPLGRDGKTSDMPAQIHKARHIFAFPTQDNLETPPPLGTQHSSGNTSSSEELDCHRLESLNFRYQYIRNTSHKTRHLYAAAEY